jgi:hypothetical protein
MGRIEVIRRTEFPEFQTIIKDLAGRIYPAKRAFQRPLTLSHIHNISATVIAFDNDNLVSGIAVLYDNPELQYQGIAAKSFGHFEAKDQATALQIFTAVSNQAKEEGFKYLVGPLNGSTWDDYRINTDQGSFELIPDNWYWPWYNDAIINAGFELVAKYYSSSDAVKDENFLPSYQKLMEKDNSDLIIRPINLNELEAELERASIFCNDAFKKNMFFTPIPNNKFVDKYRPVISRIEPWQMLIAEHKGTMVGMLFSYTMPTEKQTLVLKTLARLPEPQYSNLGLSLVYMMLQEAKARGYTKIIKAMMRYENGYWDAEKLSLGKLRKDYNLYIKSL